MRARTTRRWGWVAGTAALVAALAVAGCGASDGDRTASGTGSHAEDAASADGADLAGGAGPGAPDGAGPGGAADLPAEQAKPGAPAAQPGQPGAGVPADLRVDQRSIVYRGSLTVRVEQVEPAAGTAISIVTGAGGFVGGDERTSAGGDAEARLRLRVPADRFTAVVDELAKLGRTERREIGTEDVTEQVVDLEARIATQQARVTSGRRLLAEAKTLNDLVLLESELAKREADLASMEAKQRRLADLTALSTITLRLVGPDAKVAREDDGSAGGFLAGLRDGWTGLLATLRVVLTLAGILLPWLLVLGVPLFGLFWAARRYARRRRTAPLGLALAGGAAGRPPVPAGPVPPLVPAPRPADGGSEARPAG